MTQHQIIQNYYDAFNSGDMKQFSSFLHEDVIHDINQGTREIGKQVFIHFMEGMNRSYKEHIHDLVILSDETKNRAAAEFIVNGIYLVTDIGLPSARGQKYTLPAGAFFEFRDNLIYRVTNYYNLNNWIKQVS